MGHASVVDVQQAISGQLHDPNEVRANAFAAEFLMPRDAVRAWGGEHLNGSVTLEHVLLLAVEAVAQSSRAYGQRRSNTLTWVSRPFLECISATDPPVMG